MNKYYYFMKTSNRGIVVVTYNEPIDMNDEKNQKRYKQLTEAQIKFYEQNKFAKSDEIYACKLSTSLKTPKRNALNDMTYMMDKAFVKMGYTDDALNVARDTIQLSNGWFSKSPTGMTRKNAKKFLIDYYNIYNVIHTKYMQYCKDILECETKDEINDVLALFKHLIDENTSKN